MKFKVKQIKWEDIDASKCWFHGRLGAYAFCTELGKNGISVWHDLENEFLINIKIGDYETVKEAKQAAQTYLENKISEMIEEDKI